MHDWEFPYEPYPIQIDFMNALFKCISEKKIGIFESPTGTGKTLSLLCSSLYWLYNSSANQNTSSISEPTFVSRFKRKKLEISSHLKNSIDACDEYLIPLSATDQTLTTIPTDISLMLDQVNKNLIDAKDVQLCFKTKKIIFCSRTHSQLKQTLNELTKTKYKSKVSAISLASRVSLCINEEIKEKCSSSAELNDACQYLNEQGRCPYLPSTLSTDTIAAQFMDNFPSDQKITDIEDLYNQGKKLHICPYFSSHYMLPYMDFIAVPYNFILQPSIRKALSLDLKNCVLIFDEAHNLVDSIKNIFNQSLTLKHILSIRSQINQYFEKYKLRFKGSNQINIQTIILILDRLVRFCSQNMNITLRILSISEFLREANLENTNVYELQTYIESSKIDKKMLVHNLSKEQVKVESYKLSSIFSFLTSLSKEDINGKIEISSTDDSFIIKYFLLHVTEYFSEVVKECESLILSGGTLSPIAEMKFQLFNNQYPESKFVHFSCNHIIDTSKQLRTIQISTGPSGKSFKFTHDNLDNLEMFLEAFQTILNFSRIIPHGIIVFFPSYHLFNKFITLCTQKDLLKSLSKIKDIYYEPQSASGVPEVLKYFMNSCDNFNSKGAIIFAVINGKVSEGINFANHYGRAVILCGLPFPDQRATEINEMLNFLKSHSNNPLTSSNFLENMCMKSVNQAIGRVIRNRTDYAAIILIDSRYTQSNIYSKLPTWMMPALKFYPGFGDAFKACMEV